MFGDEHFVDQIVPAIDGERFTYVCVAYRGYGASAHLTANIRFRSRRETS